MTSTGDTSSPTGCLLVARHPNMGLFTRTVILVLEHRDKVGSKVTRQGHPVLLLEGVDTQE